MYKAADLPERLLFVDVETTGLFTSDRIVSLGVVSVETAPSIAGRFTATATHLLFDPLKKSHARAEAVHGYDDWLLRHQEPFRLHVSELRPLLLSSPFIAAHNAAFDQPYIEQEFALVGDPLSLPQFFCTMMAYRASYDGRSSLDAALRQIGIKRSGNSHGALEDAWLAMTLFFWLNGYPLPPSMPPTVRQPSNLKEAPARPPGPLPRRNNRGKLAALESERPSLDPARHTLLAAAQPTATIMMAIALADDHLSRDEAGALGLMVRATADGLGLAPDARIEHDVVGAIYEMSPTQADIESALRQILADPLLREHLAGWMREVTYSDGSGSEAESAVIVQISETVRRLRSA